MTELKKNSAITLSRQISDIIRSRIAAHKYAPGQRIDTIRQLAKEFSVNQLTVIKALNILAADRLIERVPIKGVFVSTTLPEAAKLLVIFRSNSDCTYPCHYILPKLVEEAVKKGFEIETCDFDNFSKLKLNQLKNKLVQQKVFGLIVIENNFTGDEPIINLLRNIKLPIVLAHGSRKDHRITNWATILRQTHDAWRQALEYLRDLGFRRVLTTALVDDDRLIRDYTFEEYPRLLQELGLDPDPGLVLKIKNQDYKALKQQLREIYVHHTDFPRAILSYSDFTAQATYQVLAEAGLKIPQDVAVMGFGGAPLGKLLSPSLSTINLNYAEIGRQAVETIAASHQWFKPDDPHAVMPMISVPFFLEVQNSTAVKPEFELIK